MFTPHDTALSPTALTGFDWCLAAMVALSTLFAFQKGLIRVVFSLAGLIAGTLAASRYQLPLAGFLERWVTGRLVAETIAFLAILFGVAIVFGMLGGIVRRTARAVGLGFADRLLGAAVGLVRGLLLGVAVLMAIATFYPNSGWLKKSVVAPYFLAEAHAVSFVVPQRLRDQMTDGAKRLREKTPEVLNRNLPMQ